MRVMAIVGVLCVAVVGGARGQEAVGPSQSKKADIVRLMQLTGSAQLGASFISAYISAAKQRHPDVPAAFWSEAEREMDTQGVQEQVIPIYDKYLTAEDLRGLIAFYESPLGQKLVRVQPAILQESMQVGAAWGKAVGERLTRRLEERNTAKPAVP